MTDEQKHNISSLLHRLNSTGAGPAWAEFVDHYAPIIMSMVNQFEYGQDRSGECFLYVCEKLSDDGFGRLLKFNTRGQASFRTWLGTVLFNLCVDWHRSEFGRVQMLPAISALPAFDQAIYRLSFEQGMRIETCFQTLKADFPDLTRQQLSDAISRVHQVLTPRQRWQISVRNRRRKTHQADLDQLPSPDDGPESDTQTAQAAEALQMAMALLSPDQRLLHLRFQQGLPLKKIAEMMRLGDPFRARRQLQSALDVLSGRMRRMKSVDE